jgi:outer membrane protein TolC
MRDKLLSILLFFCVCSVFTLHAQDSNITDMTSEDYAHLALPPLDVLFENAKNNPIVQFEDVKTEEEISLLKKEKKNWLKYFSVGAAYHYGVQAYTSGYSDSATPLYYQFNNNATSYYNMGGSISIPLDDLFDLKRKVRHQKLMIKQSDFQKEKNFDELKQRIIELYSSIISSLSVLKVKAEYLAFANAQLNVGKSEFQNGRGTARSLSDQKLVQIQAVSDYESTRTILISSLLKLELLTRTSIINKNKIK